MNARPHSPALLVGVLAMTCVASAGLTAQAPRAAPAPGPLEIRVHWADDGKPVEDALLQIGPRFAATAVGGVATIDGLPGGRHVLVVEHPESARVELQLELPAGMREPWTVALPRAPRIADAVLRVVLGEGDGQPVAGAMLRLTPVEMAAASQGQVFATTAGDGKVELRDLPAGRWRVDYGAPGCADASAEVTLPGADGEEPPVLELVRATETTEFEVQIVDRAGGTPLVGASVQLAGAWPAAPLAEGTTDTAGRVRFEGVRLGTFSRTAADGSLAVTHRRATLRVEAAGHVARTVPIQLAGRAPTVVALDSAAETNEHEPNDTPDTAESLPLGAPRVLTFATARDSDCFAFQLDDAALFVAEIGPKNPCQVEFELLDARGERIAIQGEHGGRAIRMARGLPPGRYVLRVGEWGRDTACAEPLTLRTELHTAPDAHEPNDLRAQARRVYPGERIRGAFLPTGDDDWFRIEVEAAGTLRAELPPHVLQQELLVYDPHGTRIGQAGVHRGNALSLDVPLTPGSYTLQLREWGDDAESVEPYELALTFFAGDAAADLRPGTGAVTRGVGRELAARGLAADRLERRGDVDVYRVPLDSSGRLHVTARSSTQLEVRAFDQHGRRLGSHAAHARQGVGFVCDVAGPLVAWLEVREWGDDAWSPSPYTLRTWWEPCDEHEFAWRNDTADTATPIRPGEMLRGNVGLRGDVDRYRLDLDHPSHVVVRGIAPTQASVAIVGGGDERELARSDRHARTELVVAADVPAGPAWIVVREWGDDAASVGHYRYTTEVQRAEPEELPPDCARELPRRLEVGMAESFVIDRVGDRDTFLVDVAAAGPVHFRLRAPLQYEWQVFDDRSGEKVAGYGRHANQESHQAIQAGGPTRYRIEITEWGNDGRSHEPGFVQVARDERPLVACRGIAEQPDPSDPTRIAFRLEDWSAAHTVHPASAALDVDRDGRIDLQVPVDGTSAEVRFPSEGFQVCDLWWTGPAGERTRRTLWVDTTGPVERSGVRLWVQHPAPDAEVFADDPALLSAISYTGAPLREARVELGDRVLARATTAPFRLDVDWRALTRGEPLELRFVARDARGETGEVRRRVTVSEYFGLTPDDGTQATGERVTVAWDGASFGDARVRVRPLGATETDWREIVGTRGRQRAVVLDGLQPGVAHEFQPLGGNSPGPVRRVTRVKGLAFGRPSYGASIARDYDQRLPISVRNHAEEPRTVRLRCGEPAEGLLLAGFVGEGCEGEPIQLGPGEEREFLLGLSAQDVLRPDHSFQVFVEALDAPGTADQAQVEVHVNLPKVELRWEDLGPTEDGLGHRFRLHNAGDALTDLRVATANDALTVSPSVAHGLLERRATRDFVVRPKLHQGFQRAAGTLRAGAFVTDVEQPVEIALPDGESLFQVELAPDAADEDPLDEELLHRARTLSAYYLDPAVVDWSQRTDPEDTDGDDRADRWRVRDELEGIEWVGDDGDGDGEVDFVRADVGFDGRFDHAAFRNAEGGWEPTNLVDAWLELGFSLPWRRGVYQKHDVELLLNGSVVDSLDDQIPEGGYVFPLQPAQLRFDSNGAAGEQEVEIRSTHLRGGHYVVSSDFALRTRMTGARVWAAGRTAEEARERALAHDDVVLDAPDFAVSSAELVLEGPAEPKRGDTLTLTVPVRNLGARATRDVAVALVAGEGSSAVEIARAWLEEVPLLGARNARFEWRAGAGDRVLRVVVDPDHEHGDWSPTNDEARVAVRIAGDDQAPTLEIDGLAENAVLDTPRFSFDARADDDGGVARIEARIDDGLWQEVRGTEAGAATLRGMLQPGAHAVQVRAIDGGGNVTLRELGVRVDAPLPEATLSEPAEGAELDADRTAVTLDVGPDAADAAVRVNGGPWIHAPLSGRTARAEVPLGYGNHDLEAVVVDDQGARRHLTRAVRGLRQPGPTDVPFVPDYLDDTMRLPFDDFGAIDLLADGDRLFVDDEPAAQSVDDSPRAGEPAAALPEPEAPRPAFVPSPPDPLDPPAGGLLAARARQSSWYCTNRPRIRVPFRLPDWLQRMELPPPGSAEFERMIGAMLDRLRAQGIDTSRLERLQEFLERRAGQMEGLREMPGWLESVGLSDGPGVDPEEQARRRQQMLDRTRAWWLRLLASGDPALIEAGLRARMDAFRSFDEGLAENAQAARDSILAHQTLAEDLVEGLPMVGEGLDLYAVMTGERLLNGQEISALERTLRAGGLLAPKILEQLLLRSRTLQRAAVSASEKLQVAGRWGRETLSELSGVPLRDVDAFLARMQRTLNRDISLTQWRLGREARAARTAFDATAEGAADLARHAEDIRHAEDLLRQLDDAADPDAFERMVLDSFQTDKTAQRLVNSDAAIDGLRARINQSLRGVYDDVDRAAVDRLNQLLRAGDGELDDLARAAGVEVGELRRFRDQMQELARRQGLDPADLRVRSQDFSGLDPSNPGRSVGRDRDVTYAVVGPGGELVDDVHHAVSRNVYEQELWNRTRGTPLPDAAAVRAHADALDQMVTSRWHPEAYASGETGFRSFLNGTGTTSRVEDIVDTIGVKSEHWWHLAGREANPTRAAQQVGEGMRQATKQWDRIIEPRLRQYTRNSALASQIRIPPDLQVGLDVFRQVETGAITAKQADAMLRRIGSSKEAVLHKMTGFFEAMEKDVGRQFRRIGAAQLDDVLASSSLARGSEAWASDALDQINDALRSGYVSEQVFLDRRGGVLRAMQDGVEAAGTPGAFSALESWVGRAVRDRRISRLEARMLREWLVEQRDR